MVFTPNPPKKGKISPNFLHKNVSSSKLGKYLKMRERERSCWTGPQVEGRLGPLQVGGGRPGREPLERGGYKPSSWSGLELSDFSPNLPWHLYWFGHFKCQWRIMNPSVPWLSCQHWIRDTDQRKQRILYWDQLSFCVVMFGLVWPGHDNNCQVLLSLFNTTGDPDLYESTFSIKYSCDWA